MNTKEAIQKMLDGHTIRHLRLSYELCIRWAPERGCFESLSPLHPVWQPKTYLGRPDDEWEVCEISPELKGEE